MQKFSQHRLLIFISVILFLSLLVAGSSVYMYNVQSALWKQSVTDVVELTAQGAHSFEVLVAKDREIVHNLVRSLEKYNSFDDDGIEERLYRYDIDAESYMVINLGKKMAHISAVLNMFIPLDNDQMEFYESLSGTGLREPYFNEYSGVKVISSYECFKFADGVDGIVIKMQPVSEIAKEYSLSFYNDEGFSYVINSLGDVIMRSRNKNSNHTMTNIFDFIENRSENDEKQINELRQNLLDGKTGAMQITTNNGSRLFAYNPISNTDGWYLLSSIPVSAVTQHTSSILQTSQIMFFITVIGIAGLAIVYLLIKLNRRSIMQKDAEIKYRDQMFDLLAQNTDDVFFMFSANDLKIEYVSANVERILGVDADLVHRDIAAIGKAEYIDGSDVTRNDLFAMKTGDTQGWDAMRVNLRTGDDHWTRETLYRVDVGKGEWDEKFIAVISDRTYEHKSTAALEEALAVAEAANRSKSAFLSNMSHDIRTPMNAIVGFATLLQRDADKEDAVREYTRKIVVSSQHLLGLINDVLDMSKIESGKTTLNIVEFNLSDTIRNISSMIRSQAAAKNQELKVKAAGVLSEHLLGDELRISQVLINILGNAVKYTEQGGTIEFLIEEIPIKNRRFAHLKFTVKDNGIGMTEEYMKTIFDPFSRAENSVTNTVQGTGLGMAITKNLVDLMGGAIDVESEQGVGSTFTVDLELRVQKTKEDERFWENNGISRILIADDDKDTCENVIGAMEGTGIDIRYELGGNPAVETARKAHEGGEPFDLYLLDLKMPDLNGVETARKIREFAKDIPIMILTSYDWEDVKEDAYEAGIDAFMPKPFFLSSFKQTIEHLRNGEKDDGEPIPGSHEEQNADIMNGKKFLAAEDNELNAEILTELLKMNGAQVEIFPNGKECAERFESSEEGEFDAILMDIQMPVMNGYEASERIRKSAHPNAKTITIIAMTANAFDDDKQNALNAGMDAHVSKPVDMDHLAAVLRDKLGSPEE